MFIMKKARVDMLAPNNNRGMTFSTDGKPLTNLLEYFVGAVELACYSLKTRLLLRDFLKYLSKWTSKN